MEVAPTLRERRPVRFWIWWDSIEGLQRWLKSIPFWMVEVTAVSFLSSLVGAHSGWLVGAVCGWAALFGGILLVWLFELGHSAVRHYRYLYIRDAVAYLMHESAWFNEELSVDHACNEITRVCREGTLQAMGRAPRQFPSWSKTDKREWFNSTVDCADIRNQLGTRGRLTASLEFAVIYFGYEDVMVHRRDLLRLFPPRP